MASDGSSMMISFVQEDWFDDAEDDGNHQNPQNISSLYTNHDGFQEEDDVMLLSGLSLESFDGADEADAETEDEIHQSDEGRVLLGGTMVNKSTSGGKDYTVDNDLRSMRNDAVGMVVITRPKGGGRSLCMDMEEVKACRDLGFELEHQGMFQAVSDRVLIPSGSVIGSSSITATAITSNCFTDSPTASWRISAPGDDPRKVKARLKAWAQAVAIASVASSPYSS